MEARAVLLALLMAAPSVAGIVGDPGGHVVAPRGPTTPLAAAIPRQGVAPQGVPEPCDAPCWDPGPGAWTHYRSAPERPGAVGASGAFPPSAAYDNVRDKWVRSSSAGVTYWVPPVAADLDGDGVAEVAVTVGNFSANPGDPGNPVEMSSGFEVLDGATGALEWALEPEAGFLDVFSPALGDIDRDGLGDLVLYHGNILTGSHLTNKFLAFDHTGRKKWEYSNVAWGTKVGSWTTVAIGDLDGDGYNEVGATLFQSRVTTTVNNTRVTIRYSDPEQRLIAIDGETASPRTSIDKAFNHTTMSNVAMQDLDGDAVLDVVWGSGIRRGTFLGGPNFGFEMDEKAEDGRILAYRGAIEGMTEAWSATTTDPESGAVIQPGEAASAPSLGDLDGDGRREVVHALWDRTFLPSASDVASVLALSGNGTPLWQVRVRAAILAPAAVADLDGDGRDEVVVQTDNGSEEDRYRFLAFDGDGNLLWRSPSFGRAFTSTPVVADLDGDGRREVLGALSPGPEPLPIPSSRRPRPCHPSCSYGVATEGSEGRPLWQYPLAAEAAYRGPVVADLDGDDDGRVELLFNTGFWGLPGTLFALEPELPDLQVTRLEADPLQTDLGSPVAVHATVRNVGSRPATAPVRLVDGGRIVAETMVSLDPGAAAELAWTWTPDEPGLRTLAVVADPAKAVAEWAEDDNRLAREVDVRGPDLAFDGGITFSDEAPPPGGSTDLTARVVNRGRLAAPPTTLRWSDGGRPAGDDAVPALEPGEGVTVTRTLAVEGAFVRTIRATADAGGAAAEESEENNVAERLLEVAFPAPDYVPTAFAAADPNPDDGGPATFRVTVRNDGNLSGDGVLVRLLDAGVRLGEARTGPLDVGQAGEVEVATVLRGAGPHRVLAVLDPDGEVAERKEHNNEAATGVVVGKAVAAVTPAKPAFGLLEQAHGLVEAAIRPPPGALAGTPLPRRPVAVEVSYVVRTDPAHDADAEAALLALRVAGGLGVEARREVPVCLPDRCVEAEMAVALEVARALEVEAGTGPGTAEVRVPLHAFQVVTNRVGRMVFRVPMAVLPTAHAGDARLAACGLALPEAGLEVAECLEARLPLPSAPGFLNLPGLYRVEVAVDWHGFPARASAEYVHA